MINLIPNQEKKKMVKDFYFNLVFVSVCALCVATFIGILALLPAYFFSSSKIRVANNKLELQKNNPAPLFDQETSRIIDDLNTKINLIEDAEKNKFSITDKIINTIFSKKSSSIKITQLSYSREASGVKKVSISGVAPSREVLLSFRKALEGSPSFKSVDLPISNFIKDSNIQFYINLIPA